MPRTFGGVFKVKPTRKSYEDRLEIVLELLFSVEKDWHYYQGFNSIAAIVVLCFPDSHEAVFYLHCLACRFFKEFLSCEFEAKRLELSLWMGGELSRKSPVPLPRTVLDFVTLCSLISPLVENLAHFFLARVPHLKIAQLTHFVLGVSDLPEELEREVPRPCGLLTRSG